MLNFAVWYVNDKILRRNRLDIFILKSFLLLFVVAFFICIFVLLMNIVWRYIEDLVGKGFSLSVLAQFFWYFALTLVPEALPLSVLMASLITFGNFGERYELLAMKTSGVSLLRVMRPITIFCVALAGVSFYFQNVTSPNASKKLYALIYSMNQKSPELEIPEGTFYDVAGYNLYVKHKDTQTGRLTGLTIYDLSKGFEEIRVIAADSGRLETTADKQHLYLRLYDGEQFENMKSQQMSKSDNPYRRETFREKHMLIDFDSDFTMVDEDIMSSQAASKNMNQIRHDIDSLSLRQDSLGYGNLEEYKVSALGSFKMNETDSANLAQSGLTSINLDSLFALESRSVQFEQLKTVQSRIKTQSSSLSLSGTSMFSGDRNIRKHWIEWMRKITHCTSILVFFFIGAPLGAIIRKGGLGVPLIVSVLTFILYYISSVSGEKMFREGEWSMIGCWLSTIVLLPLSVFFTVAANRDSTVFQMDVYKEFFRHWFGGKVNRNISCKDVIINDPDPVEGMRTLASIKGDADALLEESWMYKLPDYLGLFFGGQTRDNLRRLSSEIESFVEEMGNSRDKVILEELNSFPVIPVYGVEKPFEKKGVNKTLGIIFPIGLLFWIRAWLFTRKVRRQLTELSVETAKLSKYMETGHFE